MSKINHIKTKGKNMRVFVITCNRYTWALKPYCYLFNHFWGKRQEVVIVGYRKPSFPLPDNYEFYSIAPEEYPQEKWSNGLIKFLNDVEDDYFCLMLEDYWLVRNVDTGGIRAIVNLMKRNKNVLKVDVTNDRLHSHGDPRDAVLYKHWKHYDVIQTKAGTPYQMSLQAAIWNRKMMLSLLKPDKSPWEVEIHTSPPEQMIVLGTHQWPCRYANAVLKGKIVQKEINKVPKPQRDIIKQWIPGKM